MDKRNKASVLERPLSKGKSEVSLSAFAFLFSELVQYSDSRVESVTELESRLSQVGYQVGVRVQELTAFREWGHRRQYMQPEHALSYIRTTVWKNLFGKQADQLLQQGTEAEGQYMIIENSMLVNRYISIPKDRQGLNCAAFAAGVVHGVLDAADLTPETVEAHSVPVEGQRLPRTVILVRFKPEVVQRAKQSS